MFLGSAYFLRKEKENSSGSEESLPSILGSLDLCFQLMQFNLKQMVSNHFGRKLLIALQKSGSWRDGDGRRASVQPQVSES